MRQMKFMKLSEAQPTSHSPLQNLEEWEDFLKERYPEPAGAFKAIDPDKKQVKRIELSREVTRLGRDPEGEVVIDAARLLASRGETRVEFIFAGDVAWNSAGIELQRQKPEATLKSFGITEDHDAIATELRWLKDVAKGRTTVVVAHDGAQIDALVARGLIVSGYDLRNR